MVEARQRAASAHHRTATRHLEAAEHHERTAEALDASGFRERADEHRLAAASDREEAVRAEREAEHED